MAKARTLRGLAHDTADHASGPFGYLHPHVAEYAAASGFTEVVIDLVREPPIATLGRSGSPPPPCRCGFASTSLPTAFNRATSALRICSSGRSGRARMSPPSRSRSSLRSDGRLCSSEAGRRRRRNRLCESPHGSRRGIRTAGVVECGAEGEYVGKKWREGTGCDREAESRRKKSQGSRGPGPSPAEGNGRRLRESLEIVAVRPIPNRNAARGRCS